MNRRTCTLPIRRLLSLVVVTLLAAVGLTSVAPTAHAAPSYKAPFECGTVWGASTYSGHGNAVDLNMPNTANGDRGKPVLASAGGRVIIAFFDSIGGNLVRIDHGGGFSTYYGHLESMTVSTGQNVTTGQVIGRVGSTGSATGAHLHYEQRVNGVAQLPIRFDGNAIAVGSSPPGPTFTSTSTNGCYTPPPAPGHNGGRTITNPVSGRCLDARGGSSAPGTQVQLWDCHGQAAQAWLSVGRTLRIYSGGDERCLDITDGRQQNGTPIRLWPCNGSSAQVWTLNEDKRFTSANGLCLDAEGKATGNGTRLVLWGCYGLPNQEFVGPAINNGGSTIQGTGSQRCIDVPGWSTWMGTEVSLWDCVAGAGNQQWKYKNGALRVYAGMCLDIKNNAQVNGTPVRIWDCNGSQSQQWKVNKNGTITSTAGLCLDAVGKATANGTKLVVWACYGLPNQQWTGPAFKSAGANLYNAGAQRCLDVTGVRSLLNNTVELWDCYGGAGQTWEADGANLRVFRTMCLTVENNRQQVGTPVRISACNGSSAQHWRFPSDGTVRSAGNLCLDAIGTGPAGQANGVRMQLYTCLPGDREQQWRGPQAVNFQRPAIRGKARVKRTVRLTPGSWSRGGLSYSYQWLRNGVAIPRATSAHRRLTKADRGKRLQVRITARGAGSNPVTVLTASIRPRRR